MKKIKVIIYGCGVMGRKMAEALLEKESFAIVGAVDLAPELVSKDLGTLLPAGKSLGVTVQPDLQAALQETEAQAVILATTSHLKEIFPQIAQCAKAGQNIVSTCEELSYPWQRSPALAREIHALARECGITVVGTGINPGFLMDTLPLFLTAPCLRVDSIKAIRMMNSAGRRLPFQKKVGTALTPREFEEKIESKAITGHVGLSESIQMIAAGLGWELDDVTELLPKPVIAAEEVPTGLGTVHPGQVIGLTSIAYGRQAGKQVITLEFNAHAAVEEAYDEIMIKGLPDIHQKILGGVHGDIGTVAVTINTIPRAINAPPGLILMKDLPPTPVTP